MGGGGRTSPGKRGGGGSSLPVGMPLDFQTKLRGGGNRAASDPAQTKKIADLESRLNATIEERGLHEKAKTHSGYLLDRLLFPGGGGWGGGGSEEEEGPVRDTLRLRRVAQERDVPRRCRRRREQRPRATSIP